MFDVIVIGAGFAGLTAARDQRDAGRSVLVLEARDRIGGRTHYNYLEGLDQKVEFGGTWVVPQYQPHVAREVERYGLAYTTSPDPAELAWHFNGTHHRRRASRCPLRRYLNSNTRCPGSSRSHGASSGAARLRSKA